MKSILFILTFGILFASCEKDPLPQENWIGKNLVHNFYLVHNTENPGSVVAEWYFDIITLSERKLEGTEFSQSPYYGGGTWGILYKGNYTIGLWTETEVLGYREWGVDFSGQDVILIDKFTEEKYILEKTDL